MKTSDQISSTKSVSLLRRTIVVLAMSLLASCSTLDVILATPTFVMPTQTPPLTPTIDWFPATETSQPRTLSTQPANAPEMRPGIGGVNLTDTLTRASLWDTATSDEASAEVLNGQINLAAESNVFMYSLRHNLALDNFYVELTARPNLCRGADTYGILVRANAVAYYRFALSCDGSVSAERNSGSKRQSLQSSLPSGDVPPGAPGEVHIAVWASGTEMRLFLNDHYQFSIVDGNYLQGTIGVFVNSASHNPIVVSFSDLKVHDVDYFPPTQVPGP